MRHVLRILILTLALVLLGLALAPRAVPAQAVGPCDSDRLVAHWWILRPGEPCDGDSVTLVFGSCRNCVDLVGYEWVDRDTGVLHIDVAMPARCPYPEDCVLDTLAVPLGRLATGSHTLLYDLHVSVAAGDSTPACDFVRHASLSFTVGGPAPPGPCLIADWAHTGVRCDDFIVPGGRAKAVMTLVSSEPLAGLQGKVHIWPRGLLVAGLTPVGRAAGMHIAWERTPEGASFVMFADHGAPIGGLRCEPGTRCLEPVLAVAMVPDTDAVLPPVSHVTALDLLGADSLGGAVPHCPITTLVVVEARICAGPSCDFNGDGRLDVRDLVIMVHCLLGNGVCPDSTLAHYDCDGDGHSGLDDVLCCARRLLRGGERDSTPGRLEPNVAVEFGEPVLDAGGLRVPIRVRAADRIGAARLALALPLDRYEVAGVEVGAGNAQWLALHEALDGQVVLGLVGLAPDRPAGEPETLELTLRLTSRSGGAAGGEIALADVQASGRDGVTLDLTGTTASVPLPAPATTMLSARPNPFSGATRLSLALERAAAVEVSVHDLGGRRVATLFRGPLPAGVHEFTWDGARADGATAAHGVYFVRARVDGERLTRKLVLLRGD